MSRTPTATARRTDSALLVQCVVYVAFAAPIGMLGAGWPDAHQRFGTGLAGLGVAAGGYGLGRLVTSATALPLLRRWHVRHASSALLIGLGASCVVVASTRSFAVLVVALTANGVFGGAIDSIGNHFQTVLRDVGRAGIMFGAYGVGATAGPALVTVTSWSVGYIAAGGLALVAAWLAWRPPVRWPDAFADREPPRAVARAAEVPAGPLAVLLTVFGVYCAIEVVTADWAATVLHDHHGTGSRVAGFALSGFWAGMTLGRLGLGLVRTTPTRLMVGAATIVTACYLGLVLLPGPGAVAAVVLGGTALSAMFPTLMSTTADRVGVAAAPRVSGWELLASNVAATALAVVAGFLVHHHGSGAPAVLLATLAVVGVPLLVWSLRVRLDGLEPGAERGR